MTDLANGHCSDHADLLRRYLLSGIDCGRLEIFDCDRSGHGKRLHPPLVLVAHQCLERGLCNGGFFFRLDAAAGLFQAEQRRSAAIRLDRHHHGFVFHGDLAGGHTVDGSGEGGGFDGLLSPGPAERLILGADCAKGGGRVRAARWRIAICSIGSAAACSCT